jgi:hypothetical protein
MFYERINQNETFSIFGLKLLALKTDRNFAM